MDLNLQEERLVAELETLGVRYLSRQAFVTVEPLRSPARFLADLIQQPSSRVRMAVIAALLAAPDLFTSVHAALVRLNPTEQLTLKILYTAAVILQQSHTGKLQDYLAAKWQWLPDMFSAELGLDPNARPDERLRALGYVHRQRTGITLNWTGTYENVAHHLLHRWELERLWNQ